MSIVTYCVNGHYIGLGKTVRARTWGEVQRFATLAEGSDELDKRLPGYCPNCGAKNIDACQQCCAPIEYYRDGNAFCGACGKPFPWTEAALRSAKELTDELEDLSSDDKRLLIQSYDDLVVDTPRTTLAASRFKRIVGSLAPTAKELLTKIVVDFSTQAAKTAMGL